MDYSALARQFGGTTVANATPPTPSTGVDYSALAQKFGGTTINQGLEPQTSITGNVPGAETALMPATPLQNSNPVQATKIAPNFLKDTWDLIKGATYGTAKNIASIPGEVSGLVKESGGVGGAVKNLISTLPKSVAETVWGLVPQSAKEIANTQALTELPSQFNDLVKESGGYASALKNLASSIPGSLPEGISKYVDQIDRAGQAFINHPLIESLGYMGLKSIAENPSGALGEAKMGLAKTGEFLQHPINSLTDVGKQIGGKVSDIQTARTNQANADIIAKREQAIYDIEKNYASTRKAINYSQDEGAASRNRIASTDVLNNAVDTNGLIDTKQKGGAIDQYKAQTIAGVEDTVLRNLEREGTTVNINQVARELTKQIESSRLPPGELESALTSGIAKEIAGLSRKANPFGDIPLAEIHKAKINTTNHIDYQTPVETATLRKAIARAYKTVVEQNAKSIDVPAVNAELSKYYKDVSLLENLNGKRVKGGKLGKYFAQITGNIAGGAVGSAIGGFPGAAVGTVIGGEVASAIKGKTLEGSFGKDTGLTAPESSILQKAKETSLLPKEVDLTKPDPKVRAKSNVPRTKEVYRLENEIKNNVEAQKRAIKARDFVLVAKLKELYQFLVEKLKDIIKNKKIGLSTQDVTEGLDISTAGKIKGSHGLSAQDIMAKHPDINLKRDVPVTDVYGKKSVIPAGEALTPYELKGNKVLLQDGETYIVSKNQFQNIKGNAVSGETKPFAPELKGTEETVRKQFGDEKLPQNDNTKFSQYQLPGGKDYKEILIKAPNKESQPYIIYKNTGGEIVGKYDNYEVAKKAFEDFHTKDKFADLSISQEKHKLDYQSSHWDEPNVLSHLRLNDRTFNGKKVTFMEELQSDWAREARAGKDGVPQNPMLKNWQELSVKRALQEAVNNNSEYFAWINGEQTSARYNLATKLENVTWDSNVSGNRIVLTPADKTNDILIKTDKFGIVTDSKHPDWNGKKLDEVLGKGLADKIMSAEKGTLSGEGLKFGGEWASNLYDKQVGNIVKDLTGAKVENMDMGLPIDKGKTFAFKQGDRSLALTSEKMKVGMTIYGPDSSNELVITDVIGNGKFKAVSKAKLSNPPAPYNKSPYNISSYKDVPEGMLETFDISTKKTTQQGIKLTPEIKAKIKGEAVQLKKPSGKSPF